MKWFNECAQVDDVKKLYRDLAKQYHPDCGGSTETMQEINREYAYAIAHMLRGGGMTEEKIDQEIHMSEKYREAINKIIHLEGIVVEVVAYWIWVTGETKAVKDILKDAGFFFAYKKCAWYFRSDQFKVRNHKPMTLEAIRSKYGSQVVNKDEKKKIA